MLQELSLQPKPQPKTPKTPTAPVAPEPEPVPARVAEPADRARTRTQNQLNLDHAKHKLKCHGELCTLSQGFVWIKILLFNQLAEFRVAYFQVVYFPATKDPEDGSRVGTRLARKGGSGERVSCGSAKDIKLAMSPEGQLFTRFDCRQTYIPQREDLLMLSFGVPLLSARDAGPRIPREPLQGGGLKRGWPEQGVAATSPAVQDPAALVTLDFADIPGLGEDEYKVRPFRLEGTKGFPRNGGRK